MTKQDTGKFRNTLDQFYTNNIVAKGCIDILLKFIDKPEDYLWVEPSAGNGSFLHNIPFQKIGIDIEPKSPEIIKDDFLTWSPPYRKIIIIGNPPFGRQSSTAKAFIKKSCKFAEVIAFILPKSFVKPSMNKSFDLKFHCIYSNELEDNSFIINETPYDVPCIFQIWFKKDEDRILEKSIEPIGFNYVKETDKYDIVIRRVGALAGKCYINDGTKYSVQSHHFIKFEMMNNEYIKKINEHIFPSNTVGPRSLSKSEINVVLNEIISDSY
jgi:hypothetical protein